MNEYDPWHEEEMEESKCPTKRFWNLLGIGAMCFLISIGVGCCQFMDHVK